jgi:hypothetical protein
LSNGEHGLKVVQVLEHACESMARGGTPMDLSYD